DTKLDEISRESVLSRLRAFPQYLDVLGAPITTLATQEAEVSIGQPYANWGSVRKSFDDITNSLRRELSLISVLIIEQKWQRYFVPDEPLFGADFAAKFKTIGAYELDEAAKCLALGRSTASAFHLMRLLEIGIRAMARCLKIPDPLKPAERNWAIILKHIWDGTEKKWPTTAARMAGDGALFESLYASLDAVKNPWRNETIHVEKKYTDDEAEHIFVAVKGFMKLLASRMDENGDPKV
ncbi:MAG: hypothetical protein WB495_18165, partial [Xanthobacteraceae bacterium]